MGALAEPETILNHFADVVARGIAVEGKYEALWLNVGVLIGLEMAVRHPEWAQRMVQIARNSQFDSEGSRWDPSDAIDEIVQAVPLEAIT